MIELVEGNSSGNMVFDAMGPRMEFMTSVSTRSDDYCLIRATLPPGVVVPPHTHDDRETVYMLSGDLEALVGNKWQALRPGDVFDVLSNVRHGFRNASLDDATLIKVTTMNMARFFQRIGRPLATLVPGSLSDEEQKAFMRAAEQHGFRLESSPNRADASILPMSS